MGLQMSDDTLYADIDELIRTTDDPKDRAVILIMRRILISVDKHLSDDAALQAKVLNGLMPYHKGDHELIFALREMNVVDAVRWVNDFRKPDDVPVVYEYSRNKMLEELDSKKQFRRKMDNALFEVGKAAIWFLLGAALYGITVGYPILQKAAAA